MKTDSIEQAVIALLKEKNYTLSTAESCTGGGIGQRLTNVSGASSVYKGGIISYCNEIKHNILGVDGEILETLGAVSAPVAQQMAEGAARVLSTDFAVSVTGLAGPNSDASGKPVGLVYTALWTKGKITVWEHHFTGNRQEIRRQAEECALKMIVDYFN